MNIKIHLKTYSNNRGSPNCLIKFNNAEIKRYENITETELVVDFDADLRNINLLHVIHYGKSRNSTEISNGKVISDIAIEIMSVWFDGIKVNDNLLWEQYFFPNWSYEPNPIEPMVYNRFLGYNGTWQLAFPEDYKNWIISKYQYDRFEK